MIILLYSIIGGLAIVLAVTLFNALTAPQLEKAPMLQAVPLVSVLIPARNEEMNIKACVDGLIKQDYPKLEIFVLDDGSTDRTAEIVRQVAVRDARVKIIEGTPLPPGWLGKNWACHQLSQHASGRIFIFTDADNRHGSHAVTHTVSWMQRLRLGMLSAFCRQITHTLPEKLVVPVINMLVYSYLPLWLTYYSKNPALAAANGQWLAFTREAYQSIGGHCSVRNQVVEDVELSRLTKWRGEKILAVSGVKEVSCRMYDSWQSVWQGYSKNIFGLVSFKTISFFIILSILFLIHVAPYLLVWLQPFTTLALIAIAVNIAIRLILALKYAQPLLVGVLLHPVAIAATILIGLNSYRCYKNGKIKWKGRLVEMGTS